MKTEYIKSFLFCKWLRRLIHQGRTSLASTIPATGSISGLTGIQCGESSADVCASGWYPKLSSLGVLEVFPLSSVLSVMATVVLCVLAGTHRSHLPRALRPPLNFLYSFPRRPILNSLCSLPWSRRLILNSLRPLLTLCPELSMLPAGSVTATEANYELPVPFVGHGAITSLSVLSHPWRSL